jgi:very-short-patch-repair endonuclease
MAQHDHDPSVQLLDNSNSDASEISADPGVSNQQGERTVSVSEAVLERLMELATAGVLARCESPIEHKFLAAILSMDEAYIHLTERGSKTHSVRIDCGAFDIDVHQQVTEVVEGVSYRHDFKIGSGDTWAVVELDGHKFHERTPEQAERDKSRDRALQRAGRMALRFTGSEVFRDPKKCATEAVSMVFAALSEESLDDAKKRGGA